MGVLPNQVFFGSPQGQVPFSALHQSLSPITPYVVGKHGNYSTIQEATNAAHMAGGGCVAIQQGTYVENLTLYDQVDYIGVVSVSQGINQGVTINGTHTPPLAGHVGFNSVCLISTGDVFYSTGAGTTHIVLLNCESAVENGWMFNLVNWAGILEIYDNNPVTSGAPWAINDGCVNNTGGAQVIIYNSGAGNGTNLMTVSGNACFFGQAVTIGCPMKIVTGGNVTSVGSQYTANVTIANNGVFQSYSDSFVTGSAAAITMSSSAASSIGNALVQTSNNPAISGSGAGTLTLGNMTFNGNSTIANTLTVSWMTTTTS